MSPIKMPSNIPEDVVLATIERIVKTMASKYRFGYYGTEDIEQEARIMALQGLANYDERRPLENFLHTHVKNRLINFVRDKYRRNDPPCQTCFRSISGHTTHADGKYCKKYLDWQARNSRKQNIVIPLDISNISDEKESNTRTDSSVVEDVALREILEMIDRRLPVELRSTYLQMRDGVAVPKARRLEVEAAIKHIVKDNLCRIKEDDYTPQKKPS